MVSVGRNGKFAPPKVIAETGITIAIVGDTFTDTNTLELTNVRLNNATIPNMLDQIQDNGDAHLCIVRMRNQFLEICQADNGKPRPTDFAHARIDGATLALFERVGSAEKPKTI